MNNLALTLLYTSRDGVIKLIKDKLFTEGEPIGNSTIVIGQTTCKLTSVNVFIQNHVGKGATIF